jgi:hypothetical protein
MVFMFKPFCPGAAADLAGVFCGGGGDGDRDRLRHSDSADLVSAIITFDDLWR